MFRKDCNFLHDAVRSGSLGYIHDAIDFINSTSFNVLDFPFMKNPWLQTDTERSPMMEACSIGNLEIIQFFCRNGRSNDLFEKCQDGSTPFLVSCENVQKTRDI
jgi:hypothetical protein